MLILGQNGEGIINTDTIVILGLTADEKSIVAVLNCDSNTKETYNATLGNYFYKDRCKEIFKDMMKKADIGARVYYMPEE